MTPLPNLSAHPAAPVLHSASTASPASAPAVDTGPATGHADTAPAEHDFADLLQRARSHPARRGARTATAATDDSTAHRTGLARGRNASAADAAKPVPLAQAPGPQGLAATADPVASPRARAAHAADPALAAGPGLASTDPAVSPDLSQGEPAGANAAELASDTGATAPEAIVLPEPGCNAAQHMAHWLTQAQAWVPSRADAAPPDAPERAATATGVSSAVSADALATASTGHLHGLADALATRPVAQTAQTAQAARAAELQAALPAAAWPGASAMAVASATQASHMPQAQATATQATPAASRSSGLHAAAHSAPVAGHAQRPGADGSGPPSGALGSLGPGLSGGSTATGAVQSVQGAPADPATSGLEHHTAPGGLAWRAEAASDPFAPASAEPPPDLAGAVAAEVDAPVGSPQFGPALGARLAVLARNGVEQARLELNPAELGPVSAHIALDGASARIDFVCDVPTTRDALEASLPALAAALRDGGLTLSGGGVFDRPRQPRDEPASAPAGGVAGGARTARGIEAAAAQALPRSTRGVVDLVA